MAPSLRFIPATFVRIQELHLTSHWGIDKRDGRRLGEFGESNAVFAARRRADHQDTGWGRACDDKMRHFELVYTSRDGGSVLRPKQLQRIMAIEHELRSWIRNERACETDDDDADACRRLIRACISAGRPGTWRTRWRFIARRRRCHVAPANNNSIAIKILLLLLYTYIYMYYGIYVPRIYVYISEGDLNKGDPDL